jgi:hypothetical protein
LKWPHIIYRTPAIKRMFERRVSEADIQAILRTGETIEDYPDDTPYPSRLVLGWCDRRPLHVVVADDLTGGNWIVITVYEPDPDLWERDFRKRRP